MIELTHVSKDFGKGQQQIHAVRDVSLSVDKGEIFGIIGFSGAGKSTLVRCINLLERPTAGTVTVDGKDMTALSARELRQARKKIGMDTFIFRNTNDNIRVFEIDHPDTQRFKKARIRQLEWTIPTNARLVPIDFSKDDMITALLQAGFDPKLSTFFSVLGVTYYLPLELFENTVKKMGSFQNPENQLVFDFPDEGLPIGSARGAELAHITAMLGEPMALGYKEADVMRMLRRCGFRCEQHLTPKEIEKRYFSSRSDDLHAFENIHFILAKKENLK